MKKEIEVNVSCEDNDVKQALLNIINHVHKSWVAFPCFLLILIGMVLYGINAEFDIFVYGVIIVSTFAILLFYILFYKRPIDSYINFYSKRKGVMYIFSEDGIKANGEEIQSSTIWSVFITAYDIPSAFIFLDVNRFFYIFPKRFFDSSDVEQLHQLISEKVINFKTIKK